ncbi:MAG: hypothetical protein R3F62_11100 [Planctomycetota bacterium]
MTTSAPSWTRPASEASSSKGAKVREAGRGSHLRDYWPLACLVLVCGLAALAISTGFATLAMRPFMHAYMGVFLSVFALLKLFDPSGFADGFQMYDLLAKRGRVYAYVYPVLELGLGLGYLSFLWPTAIYAATIAVFTFGALGVISALRRGLDIECPCMGSILSVPLSTVTLTEDGFMVGMAIALLAL